LEKIHISAQLPAVDPRNLRPLSWENPHVKKVVTAGYPDSLGLFAFNGRRAPTAVTVEGYACLRANLLGIDIRDDRFHDVDQTLSLRLLMAEKHPVTTLLGYDKNAEAEALLTLSGDKRTPAVTVRQDKIHNQPIREKDRLVEYTITLDRARLSNRGMGGTDLALAALATMLPVDEYHGQETQLTLCDLSINSPLETQVSAAIKPTPSINVDFRVLDEDNTATPVRVGLYDDSGRLIYANSEAIALPYYANRRSVFSLRAIGTGQQQWPHKNRYYFYSDGDWSAELAAGRYTLVATKGPEYRQLVNSFDVRADTTRYDFKIQRWINMPALGWHSGDVHIHASRDDNKADHNLFTAFAAEDIHLANLLEMSNLGRAHYSQFDMGQAQPQQQGRYIVPGVEAPRTAQRGHAMALNTQSHHRDPDQYFLYHQHLKTYQQQGAITGYAHVGSEEFLASLGLAIDVPWGLVDFVENMQNGQLRTELWYDFLNLGYTLSPAAGSDYPYFDQPGAVRSYVKTHEGFKTDPGFEHQQWFTQLKAGRTFITNGPMLEFSVNGLGMGEHLAGDKSVPLSIRAQVQLNPEVDALKTVELIHCGKTIHTEIAQPGQSSLLLSKTLDKIDYGWLAIKATGYHSTQAHSAPIYINRHNQPSWCPPEFVKTLTKMQTRLDTLKQLTPSNDHELEFWETGAIQSLYQQQKDALNLRIEETSARYNERLEQFRREYLD